MKNCETLERMLKMSEGDHEKTGKVISRSFYKILRQNGFTHAEIMSVAGFILDEIMKDIKANGKDKEKPVAIRQFGSRSRTGEVA